MAEYERIRAGMDGRIVGWMRSFAEQGGADEAKRLLERARNISFSPIVVIDSDNDGKHH